MEGVGVLSGCMVAAAGPILPDAPCIGLDKRGWGVSDSGIGVGVTAQKCATGPISDKRGLRSVWVAGSHPVSGQSAETVWKR